MPWLFLLAAIVSEVLGTICLKLSEGFSRWQPSALMLVLYGLSFALLGLGAKKIPISIAYAVWSGIGTAMIALAGAVFFKEPLTLVKLACIGLIILGCIGLNLNVRH